ncbi:ABC-F family ATP-binding cassette domain-containing protein [Bacillus sp. 2205SS5-2]|uniref:ABC-F family ATP-binding cassette domain-containing protein n=1 Tax=Bacillus sp. 2205SS5-2 TaxID=3109031 RepID=UPI0030078AD8
MILLQVNNVTKYFGAEMILSNIKLELKSKDRIALVGRNGAGKSTLLKIISNQLSFDSGEIIKPKHVTMGYLAQHTGLESSLSIWDEMLSVFEHVLQHEADLRKLELEMASPDIYENTEAYERTLSEYDRLTVKFKDLGGYQYESDIRSILHGLNFANFDYSTKISTLSGGQKTRLALAKLLLTKPDLLILDEPTNHLDIETLSWLEQYLQGYSGSILIVSHDRYFLDKVVNHVYEVSRRNTKKYHGNYSDYLQKKADDYERESKQFERQQAEVARLQDFIQKNIARASTTKMAQSRRKKLERMDLMSQPLGDEKSAHFSFEIERQSGNDVLKVQDLTIGYHQEPISSNIKFQASRGDSIALVGPNGVGKSTLIKTLVGKLPSLSGNYHFGANVKIGYYDQEQAELTSNKTVIHELWDDYSMKTEKEIRTVLGNFLFSGDDVLKSVSTLSGGEKARLALAKMMLEKSNVLILDEPTNHLDLDSKEVLENALIHYPGTILFVSHDRYFINRIATKVLELSTTEAKEYLGDYDYYVHKKEEMIELALLEEKERGASIVTPQIDTKENHRMDKEAKKLERQRIRRIEEIEEYIEKLENEIEEKEAMLFDSDIYQNAEKVKQLNDDVLAAQKTYNDLLEEWEQLQT